MKQQLEKLIPKTLHRHIKLFVHRGSNYVCPFCNYQSKDLAVIGFEGAVRQGRKVIGGGRRFGGCYRCGATDREKLVVLFLRDNLGFFSAKKS